MSDNGLRPTVQVERLDADAVCERCGTVNPEETLLCKTCGNNLRDQRANRALLEQVAEAESGPKGGVWLGRLAIVFGILLLIWVAMNLNRIADTMVGAQAKTTGDPSSFWSGPKGRTLDKMAADLKANPVSEQEADLAMSQKTPLSDYSGRYVIVQRGQMQQIPIGQAIVQMDGSAILFVAQFPSVRVEVRGEASPEGPSRYAARDSAGVLANGEYYGATGFAQVMETGGLECLGLCGLSEQAYSAVAYRVP